MKMKTFAVVGEFCTSGSLRHVSESCCVLSRPPILLSSSLESLQPSAFPSLLSFPVPSCSFLFHPV